MADLQAITQVANGGLEANSNISTGPAVAQTGQANGEGVAATLARSDHLHLMQGFENLAADPTSNNFKGRVYWNTATLALRYCTDATGTGTFADVTPTAASLVVHAAQHKDGGHDPLPDNILTDHMKAVRTVYSAQLAAGVSNISGTAYTTIQDLSVTTTGIQTLAVSVHIRFLNTLATKPQVAFRVKDQTAGGTPTIFYSIQHQLGASGGGSDAAFLSAHFFYTVPAGGARTLRVQAGADTANSVNVSAQNGFNSENTAGASPIIQAVIV